MIFDWPWCFAARSNRPLQSSNEFFAGVEVLFSVGFLWNFSLFIFGLAHFLVHVFLIILSLYYVLQCSSLRGSIIVCFSRCFCLLVSSQPSLYDLCAPSQVLKEC